MCFASGFREAGADDAEGERLQDELLIAAGDMPIIGPNCYGLINYGDGALLWPDQHGGVRLPEGRHGVAIITQSSNIAINLTMQKRGLPLAYLMTAGNQAQTGLSEMALGLIEDERVSALGLHIEGFDSVAGFERLAARARELQKPIVAMKAGRSEAARAATISHTASLAGSDAASDAFLKRLGIARVHSIPSFLETLKLLHVIGPLPGNRLSSMSCSGGEASVIADAALGQRVVFPAAVGAPSQACQGDARAAGGGRQSARLPDLHLERRAGDDRRPSRPWSRAVSTSISWCSIFRALDRCSDADWWPTVNAFEAALKATCGAGRHRRLDAGKPAGGPLQSADGARHRAAFRASPRRWTRRRRRLRSAQAWNLPILSPVRGEVSRRSRDGEGAIRLPKLPRSPPRCVRHLSPSKGERMGASSLKPTPSRCWPQPALRVPRGLRADSVEKAVEAAVRLGFPVAVKALGVAHKSEAGAVRLCLIDAASVREAAGSMAGPGSGFYVERMVAGGVAELIVGITRDPLFGPVMTLGSGGVLVELLKDSVTLLLPASPVEVEAALRNLKLFPLLDGFRGRPKADLDAAVGAILDIAAFALDHAEEIAELDVNPLIVCGEGEGAWVADALLVVCPTFPLWAGRREASGGGNLGSGNISTPNPTGSAGRPSPQGGG